MSLIETPPAGEAAIWHDVECGAFAADLTLWRKLTAPPPRSVLELGAGTGRVALNLAAAGHNVVAVEIEPALAAALEQRADGAVEVVLGDLLELDLAVRFDMALAPMQLLQVLGGRAERIRCLEVMVRHLNPAGIAAAAIVERLTPADLRDTDVLPDVRDTDAWIYSSFPLSITSVPGAVEARRVRERVSPAGALVRTVHVDRLANVSAAELDAEAGEAGLRPLQRWHIPDDDSFVGSTVCIWGLA